MEGATDGSLYSESVYGVEGPIPKSADRVECPYPESVDRVESTCPTSIVNPKCPLSIPGWRYTQYKMYTR